MLAILKKFVVCVFRFHGVQDFGLNITSSIILFQLHSGLNIPATKKFHSLSMENINPSSGDVEKMVEHLVAMTLYC